MKKFFIAICTSLALLVLVPAVVLAAPIGACDNPNDVPPCPNSPQGVAGDANPGTYVVDASSLPHTDAGNGTIRAVLNIVFAVIGSLSLLMVTIGGFKYIASQGDSQATAKAKNTILYALIGVVVSILSISIVTFVLGNV